MDSDSNGWQTRLEKKIISIFKGNKVLSLSVAALTYFYANYASDVNKYLDDLWFSTSEIRVISSLINTHCAAFKDSSEEDKIKYSFYKNLNQYNSQLTQKLIILTSKADDIDRQGTEIHDALVAFLVYNWDLSNHITRYNSCPNTILTDQDLKNLEYNLKLSFPLTFWSYIIYYTKLIFIWKIGFKLLGLKVQGPIHLQKQEALK